MNLIIDKIEGRGFSLPGNNLDTDRIIPARFLVCVTFEGLGENAFIDDRKKLNGEHPFDKPENKDSPILVVDENFGSGSSREHAVPALTQRGIRAIIGLSFAEIFSGNAVGNGLVCVTVEKSEHEVLLEAIAYGYKHLVIDLEKMEIVATNDTGRLGFECKCTMPSANRDMLITGKWNQIVTLLEAGDLIEQTARALPYMAGAN